MAKTFVDPDLGDKITLVHRRPGVRIITEYGDRSAGHGWPNRVIDLTYDEVEVLRDFLNGVLDHDDT